MDIEPTFKGYIEDDYDALLILQAILNGTLKHIHRRPYEIERPYLIISGSIFIFIEEISGIKRWTDGVSWSPSRISGKFLIYRELNKTTSHPMLSKKKAILQDPSSSSSSSASKIKLPPLLSRDNSTGNPTSNIDNPSSTHSSPSVSSSITTTNSPSSSSCSPSPLSSSSASLPITKNATSKKYTGFVKKTISVRFKDSVKNTLETLHVVSYYKVDDVKQNKLSKIKDIEFFKDIKPCQELLIAMENTTLGNGNKNSNVNVNTNNNSPLNSNSDVRMNLLSKNTAGSITFQNQQQPLPFTGRPAIHPMYQNDDHYSSPTLANVNQFQPTISASTNSFNYSSNSFYPQQHQPPPLSSNNNNDNRYVNFVGHNNPSTCSTSTSTHMLYNARNNSLPPKFYSHNGPLSDTSSPAVPISNNVLPQLYPMNAPMTYYPGKSPMNHFPVNMMTPNPASTPTSTPYISTPNNSFNNEVGLNLSGDPRASYPTFSNYTSQPSSLPSIQQQQMQLQHQHQHQQQHHHQQFQHPVQPQLQVQLHPPANLQSIVTPAPHIQHASNTDYFANNNNPLVNRNGSPPNNPRTYLMNSKSTGTPMENSNVGFHK